MIIDFTKELPEKVKFGWREYDIEIIKNLRGEDGLFLNGHITYHDQKIRIEESLPLKHKWVVLIHEILHAIAYANGDTEKEETIHSFAEGLGTLIIQNEQG